MSQSVEKDLDNDSVKKLDDPAINFYGIPPVSKFSHKPYSYASEDMVVAINLCQADIEPLIVCVKLDDQDAPIYDCLVDSGAGVNLISSEIVPFLGNPKELLTSEDIGVRAISGFGNRERIPIAVSY